MYVARAEFNRGLGNVVSRATDAQTAKTGLWDRLETRVRSVFGCRAFIYTQREDSRAMSGSYSVYQITVVQRPDRRKRHRDTGYAVLAEVWGTVSKVEEMSFTG